MSYLCGGGGALGRRPAEKSLDKMDTWVQILVEWGYWGLFLSAFVAGSILPFSSEAVMLILIRMGASPVWCVVAATLGNTLGGMTCYGIGRLGCTEWIEKLGVKPRQLARARKFMAGRGAWMGFFGFLPTLGEALAVMLGLMRSNVWVVSLMMTLGKLLRYLVLLWSFEGMTRIL